MYQADGKAKGGGYAGSSKDDIPQASETQRMNKRNIK